MATYPRVGRPPTTSPFGGEGRPGPISYSLEGPEEFKNTEYSRDSGRREAVGVRRCVRRGIIVARRDRAGGQILREPDARLTKLRIPGRIAHDAQIFVAGRSETEKKGSNDFGRICTIRTPRDRRIVGITVQGAG